MTDLLDRTLRRRERPLRNDQITQLPLPAPVAPHPSHHGFGHGSSVVMLLPMRVFLAAGWLRAGAAKLIDRNWWDGSELKTFLHTHHAQAVPFFRPVMDHAVAPAAAVVAITVMVTQILCGALIGTGKMMRLALRWGFLMNVTFVLAGQVNPSVFYLVMEIVLLFAIADGTIGVNPSRPSRRTLIAAGISLVLAAVLVPYIRTIEPAGVIEDPAMMLAFVGALVTATLVVRAAADPTFQRTRLARLWVRRVASWTHAKPRWRIENVGVRDHVSGGAHFPPPQGGTAFSVQPPSAGH